MSKLRHHNSKPPPAGQDRSGQLRLPIDYAPAIVRSHGYTVANSRPLVGNGKDINGVFRPHGYVAASEAWGFPSIELRTRDTFPAIILDLDRRGAAADVHRLSADEGLVPAPNWMVERAGGGAHAVWCLRSAVHWGERARQKPLRLLARVSEWMGSELACDPSYTGVLTHNPTYQGQLANFIPWWGPTNAYELRELADYIPDGWRKPKLPATGIGRNCWLFDAMMKWAGRLANLRLDVLTEAWRVNLLIDRQLATKRGFAHGFPTHTVDTTIFEMWIGSLSTHRGLAIPVG